jgi:hypothetical protein
VSDVRNAALRDLLDERTADVTPHPDALERVRTTARRRHRRRRVAGGATALVATTVALSFAGGILREPLLPAGHVGGRSSIAQGTLVPLGAVSLRASIGITGNGKDEVGIVVAKSPSPGSHRPVLTARQVGTGLSLPIPKNAASVSFSPQDTTVALVTKDNQVVLESTVNSDRHVLGHQRPGAAISWDPNGTALFAFVGRHWILVPAPNASGTVVTKPRVRVLRVPRLPGGPSFLSVSPAKDLVVLFGVTPAMHAPGGDRASDRTSGRPHLYVGRFEGLRVTDVHRLHVPATAFQGPVGWLGNNAFVIGTGVGSAWIVRVDGSHLVVTPALPEGCALAGAPASCRSRGPHLLGTNESGSLLYWRVRGVPDRSAVPTGTADGAGVVAYFSTWLDGSHPKQLTGPSGTYGPALAAR